MTRTLKLLLVFISFCFAFQPIIGQEEWVQFKVEDGLNFSVEAPGPMEESSKRIKTAVGELEVVTFSYQGTEEDPNYLYLINMVQYPEGMFPKDSLDLKNEFLDNSIVSSVDRVQGELIYSTSIESGKGKLFRIKYNDGNAIVKGKSYLIKDVFVNLQVFTIQNKSLNDEMDYFLDSFKMKF